jgi:ADP-ribose pyrophosphatase YjhB (NUDIX family)
VELGETPQSCAAREVNEELNITVNIGHCLGMRSLKHRDKQLLYVWFSADIAAGNPTIVEHGIHDRLDYMSWDDLRLSPQEHLSSSVRALIAARDEAMGWESNHRPGSRVTSD